MIVRQDVCPSRGDKQVLTSLQQIKGVKSAEQ